jgi:hypothetical protein
MLASGQPLPARIDYFFFDDLFQTLLLGPARFHANGGTVSS